MLKILLTILILIDLAGLTLLVFGLIVSIKEGGGSVLFPGLGLVVALPLVLGVLFVFELMIAGLTVIVYKAITKGNLV